MKLKKIYHYTNFKKNLLLKKNFIYFQFNDLVYLDSCLKIKNKILKKMFFCLNKKHINVLINNNSFFIFYTDLLELVKNEKFINYYKDGRLSVLLFLYNKNFYKFDLILFFINFYKKFNYDEIVLKENLIKNIIFAIMYNKKKIFNIKNLFLINLMKLLCQHQINYVRVLEKKNCISAGQ